MHPQSERLLGQCHLERLRGDLVADHRRLLHPLVGLVWIPDANTALWRPQHRSAVWRSANPTLAGRLKPPGIDGDERISFATDSVLSNNSVVQFTAEDSVRLSMASRSPLRTRNKPWTVYSRSVVLMAFSKKTNSSGITAMCVWGPWLQTKRLI